MSATSAAVPRWLRANLATRVVVGFARASSSTRGDAASEADALRQRTKWSGWVKSIRNDANEGQRRQFSPAHSDGVRKPIFSKRTWPANGYCDTDILHEVRVYRVISSYKLRCYVCVENFQK